MPDLENNYKNYLNNNSLKLNFENENTMLMINNMIYILNKYPSMINELQHNWLSHFGDDAKSFITNIETAIIKEINSISHDAINSNDDEDNYDKRA